MSERFYRINGSDKYHKYGQCGHLKKAVEPVNEINKAEVADEELEYCLNCKRLDDTLLDPLEYNGE